MKLYQKLGIGSLVGIITVAGSALLSFAQVPTADATVSANITGLVTGLNNAGITGLGTVITVGGVLLVTAALLFWVVKHFRALVHI